MQDVFLGGVVTYVTLYLCLIALRVPLGRAQQQLRWLQEQSIPDSTTRRVS